MNFGKGIFPGLIVYIPEVDFEATKAAWIGSIQSKTKSNVVEENGEISIFGANIKSISKTPVNIFSKIINQDTMLQLSAIFELKKDVYIEKNTGENELADAKSYLREFAKNQYLELAKKQLATEEKLLKSLTKELETIKSKKSNLQKDIVSDHKSINEEQKEISIQNDELAKLKIEITAQSNQLVGMEKGNIKDEKEKYIKSLEKREKDLTKDLASSENKINKAKIEIDNANIEIQKCDVLQQSSRKKITQQETVVKNYTNKLNRIKKY